MKNLIPSTGLVTDSWIPGMGMYERARNLLGDPVLSQLDQAEKQLIQNYQSKLGGRLGQSFVNPSDYTQKLQSQIGDRVRQDLANTFPSVKDQFGQPASVPPPDVSTAPCRANLKHNLLSV